jgi:hypothetical protein
VEILLHLKYFAWALAGKCKISPMNARYRKDSYLKFPYRCRTRKVQHPIVIVIYLAIGRTRSVRLYEEGLDSQRATLLPLHKVCGRGWLKQDLDSDPKACGYRPFVEMKIQEAFVAFLKRLLIFTTISNSNRQGQTRN